MLPDLFPQNSGPTPGGENGTTLVWQRYLAQSHRVLSALNRPDIEGLSALPAGVADVAFAEFFGPIGDRGLEYSPKLHALDGQLVRIVGYMIREPERAPGLFRLARAPLTLETEGRCAPDTAPASVVHVFVSAGASRRLPYRPGRLVLLGRLEIGPRLEADGRNSIVRLILTDEVPAPHAGSRADTAGR
jgi:hypothetical protein